MGAKTKNIDMPAGFCTVCLESVKDVDTICAHCNTRYCEKHVCKKCYDAGWLSRGERRVLQNL